MPPWRSPRSCFGAPGTAPGPRGGRSATRSHCPAGLSEHMRQRLRTRPERHRRRRNAGRPGRDRHAAARSATWLRSSGVATLPAVRRQGLGGRSDRRAGGTSRSRAASRPCSCRPPATRSPASTNGSGSGAPPPPAFFGDFVTLRTERGQTRMSALRRITIVMTLVVAGAALGAPSAALAGNNGQQIRLCTPPTPSWPMGRPSSPATTRAGSGRSAPTCNSGTRAEAPTPRPAAAPSSTAGGDRQRHDLLVRAEWIRAERRLLPQEHVQRAPVESLHGHPAVRRLRTAKARDALVVAHRGPGVSRPPSGGSAGTSCRASRSASPRT